MRLMKIPTVRVNDPDASPNRKKWGLFFFISALAISGLIGLSTTKTGSSGIAAMLADPLSVLAGRSPGERGPGALTSTKPSFAVLPSVRSRPKPTERVLSTVRERAPAGGISAIDPLEVAFTPLALDSPLPGGIGGSPLPFGSGPSGIEDGGVPRDPDTPDVPPVPGVPEPATWLTMVLGFFAIGTMLRHSRVLASRTGRVASTQAFARSRT